MANDVKIRLIATDEASKPINNVDKSLEGLNKTASVSKAQMAAAGAAILGSMAAIGVTAVKTFADFEKTMSGVNAVLSPTAQEFDNLTTKARDLGKTTTFSATEAASGIEMLAKNGLSATQILDGAADASLNLAAATGADLSTAADIASSAMLTFGLEAKNLGSVVDGITGVTNVSKFGIEDYSLALAQGGGVAKLAGLSLDEFNTSITAISPLFKSGSDAGTSFKTFLQRLVPASDAAEASMKQLGLITKDGKNQFYDAAGAIRPMNEISGLLAKSLQGLSDEQKNATLQTIFGTDAIRAAAGLAATGSDKFNEYATAIGKTSAADNASKRLNNLSGAFEQLSGAVDDIMISLGGLLAPMVRTVAEGLTVLANGVSFLGDLFKNLPAPVQEFISKFAGVSTAVLAGVAAFAVLQVTLGGVATAFAAILVSAAPFIGIAAAITAAVIGLKVAWDNNFLGIRDITMQVASAIQGAWESVVAFFQANIQPAIMAIAGYFQEIAPLILNELNRIKDIVMTVFNSLQPIIQPAMEFIKNYITTTWNVISTTISSVFNTIKSITQTAWAAISGVIKAGLQILQGDWSGAWNTVKNTAQNIWDGIKNTLSSIWNGIKSLASSIWNAITSSISNALTLAVAVVKTMWENISNATKNILTNVLNTVKNIFNGIPGAIQSVASNIVSTVQNIMNSILNTITGAIGGAIDAARSIGTGIADGLENGFTAKFAVMSAKVNSQIDQLMAGIAAHAGVQSPSVITKDVGANIGEGLIIGMMSKVPALDTASKLVLKTVLDKKKALQDGYKEAAESIGKSLDDMTAKHTEKMQKLQSDLVSTKDKLKELEGGYSSFLKGEAQSFGSEFVKQEDKVKSLATELEKARAELIKGQGEGGGDTTEAQARVTQIQAQLDKEKAALEEAKSFYLTNKSDQNAQELLLQQQLEEQKRILATSTNVEERANAEARILQLTTDIEFMKTQEGSLATQQQAFATQVATARISAGKTEFQRFIDNMQMKRLEENKKYEEEKALQQKKLLDTQNALKSEVDTYNIAQKTMVGLARAATEQQITMLQNVSNVTGASIQAQIKAYQDLAHAAQMAAQSASAAPRIRVGYADGGLVKPQGFADGGMAGISPRDTVPAYLTPGEVVLNAAQQGNVASAIQGGGKTIQVTVTGNQFVGATDELAENIGEMIISKFKQQYAFESF